MRAREIQKLAKKTERFMAWFKGKTQQYRRVDRDMCDAMLGPVSIRRVQVFVNGRQDGNPIDLHLGDSIEVNFDKIVMNSDTDQSYVVMPERKLKELYARIDQLGESLKASVDREIAMM